MVKMIALFKKPVDEETFLDHYENIHLPMIRKMPGLLKLELHKMYHPRGGVADPFLMAEMYFENQESLLSAMKSPEGKAGGKDLQSFAADYVEIMFAEVKTEEF